MKGSLSYHPDRRKQNEAKDSHSSEQLQLTLVEKEVTDTLTDAKPIITQHAFVTLDMSAVHDQLELSSWVRRGADRNGQR